MGAAPLPRRSGQGGADRRGQTRVGVAGDESDAGQAAGDQVAQERQPTGAILSRSDVQAL